jgi:hypothetical protein
MTTRPLGESGIKPTPPYTETAAPRRVHRRNLPASTHTWPAPRTDPAKPNRSSTRCQPTIDRSRQTATRSPYGGNPPPTARNRHSQGARILKELIQREIDRSETTIDQGGEFEHLPACRSTTQTGCVVAYSSWARTPPRGRRLPRTWTTLAADPLRQSRSTRGRNGPDQHPPSPGSARKASFRSPPSRHRPAHSGSPSPASTPPVASNKEPAPGS